MKHQIVLSDNRVVGTGWLPPLPDLRDYTEIHPKIETVIQKLALADSSLLPDKVDLRQWCSKIQDQGKLGSCTAHAAAGIIEYFERRSFSKEIGASRLFIYKNARNLRKVTGDKGAYLRDTMAALVICGVPSENYWEYTDNDPDFDREPSSFIYAVADNYEALQYFCHDSLGTSQSSAELLSSVKRYLVTGIPSMFGFYGFSSFTQADIPGGIPYPSLDEQAQWGHAVVAVGYDDTIKIKNIKYNQETTGALLIRNSWGSNWGDQGYGWLPYDYVLNKLATDFWSLLSMEWIDTDQFGI